MFTRSDILAKFVFYPDANGEYRWRIKAKNGKIIAVPGEGYNSLQAAEEGALALYKHLSGFQEPSNGGGYTLLGGLGR